MTLILNDFSGINPQKKCHVYYNLHKHCLSVQQGGIVVAHVEYLNLKNVDFSVQKAGREKCIKEKQKNIHAFISGYLGEDMGELKYAVSYNPYKHDFFIFMRTKPRFINVIMPRWKINIFLLLDKFRR